MAWICKECLKEEENPIVCAVIKRYKEGAEMPKRTADGLEIDYPDYDLICDYCGAEETELTEILK